MYAKNEILIAAGQLVTASLTDAVALTQPANFTDVGCWADEVGFALTVVGVNGAPSAWSLGIKFQFMQPHAGSNTFQYTTRTWFDLQQEQTETCIVEGVGWYGGNHVPPVAGEYGIVADQGDTLPISVQRTVVHFGSDVRIKLDPQFTGGTAPSLSLALTRIPKGS